MLETIAVEAGEAQKRSMEFMVLRESGIASLMKLFGICFGEVQTKGEG